MDSQSHHILVLGHSFVAHLATCVAAGALSCLDPKFGFLTSISVKLHGIGGRTVDSLRNFDLHVVQSFQRTVFLEIGSNHLAHAPLPLQILITNILHIIHLLHFFFGVPHIIGTQVLKRHHTNLPYPSYNARVFEFNYRPLQIINQLPFDSFWFHRKITQCPPPILLRDGVHLNKEENHLLYHSYHEAIHFYTARFATNY